MASNELLIKINGDPSGFDESLNEVGNSAKTLQQNLGNIAKVSGVAFAGLTAGIASVVGAFRQQEQAQFQVAAALESTGGIAGLTADELSNMASSLQDVTTFSDDTIARGQSLLLTFTNIRKEAFEPATKAALDLAERMRIDLNSAVLLIGKALNAPTQNLGALTRAGIQFNDEQRELIKTMTESGDVAGAQAIILRELESQNKNAAVAAAQGTGAFLQFQNVLGNIAENLGAVLAPTLINITKRLTVFAKIIRDNETAVKTLAIGLGVGAVGAGLVFGLSTLGLLLPNLVAGFGALNFAIIGSTTAVRGLVGATGVGLLLIAIPLVIQNFDELVNFMNGPFFAAFAFVEVIIRETIGKFKALGSVVVNIAKGRFSDAVDAAKVALTPLPFTLLKAGREAAKAFTDGQNIGQQLEKDRLEKQNAQLQAGLEQQKRTQQSFAGDQVEQQKVVNGQLEQVSQEKLNSLVSIENDLGTELLSIDQSIGDDQVSIFDDTTDRLLSAAQERSNGLAAASESGDRGGSRARSGRGSGGGSGFVVPAAEGSALRRIIEGQTRGVVQFRQGQQPVIVETGAGPNAGGGNLLGQTSGSQSVKIDIAPRAAQFITVKNNENQRLGTDRAI